MLEAHGTYGDDAAGPHYDEDVGGNYVVDAPQFPNLHGRDAQILFPDLQNPRFHARIEWEIDGRGVLRPFAVRYLDGDRGRQEVQDGEGDAEHDVWDEAEAPAADAAGDGEADEADDGAADGADARAGTPPALV